MYKNIEIDGKKYPVSFGMNALSRFTKEAGITLQQFGNMQDMDIATTMHLVFCGLADGHRKARKAGEVKGEFSLTIEDVGDLVDNDKGALTNILGVLTDALPAEGGNGKQQITKGRKRKSRLNS